MLFFCGAKACTVSHECRLYLPREKLIQVHSLSMLESVRPVLPSASNLTRPRGTVVQPLLKWKEPAHRSGKSLRTVLRWSCVPTLPVAHSGSQLATAECVKLVLPSAVIGVPNSRESHGATARVRGYSTPCRTCRVYQSRGTLSQGHNLFLVACEARVLPSAVGRPNRPRGTPMQPVFDGEGMYVFP